VWSIENQPFDRQGFHAWQSSRFRASSGDGGGGGSIVIAQ
jgi:hypothetical protein